MTDKLKKRRLKPFTKLTEALLFLCGITTSIVVILMVIFLFSEGFGISGQPQLEPGYVIIVHKSNPTENLTNKTIKEIFDGKITNWNEVIDFESTIIPIRLNEIIGSFEGEDLGKNLELLPEKINVLVSQRKGIIAYLPQKLIPIDFEGKIINIPESSFLDFFTGALWYPTAKPVALFGIIPLLAGTFLVSLTAILIALPFGIATAIYLAEIASDKTNIILKPVIELLAAIPSIVYGFFGLVVLVPFIRKLFSLPVGETALSGSIILAIMALPTIITISEDAIKNTPPELKEASFALGASHLQTILRVIIPHSISGIVAAAILGIGRAIGETMAVLMVTGNAAIIPGSLLDPIRTIPATIAAELGEAATGEPHFKSLFALGCVLFIISLAINFCLNLIGKREIT